MAEAREFPGDRDAFEDELARRGWPTARAVIEDPTLLAMLVEGLDHDFLLHVADKSADADDFVLNTIEQRHVDGEHIVVSGRCRRPATGVCFRDV